MITIADDRVGEARIALMGVADRAVCAPDAAGRARRPDGRCRHDRSRGPRSDQEFGAGVRHPRLGGVPASPRRCRDPPCADRRRWACRRSKVSETIEIVVNGERMSAVADVRMTLADFLREKLGLTGTHLGCEHGVCGVCTVIVDDVSVRSCLMLAMQARGKDVLTVEGLGDPEHLHPLQQAMRERHSFQCGFCTPGFVMSALVLAAGEPVTRRGRGPRGPLGQHLPLHGLPEHRGGRAARGGARSRRRAGHDDAGLTSCRVVTLRSGAGATTACVWSGRCGRGSATRRRCARAGPRNVRPARTTSADRRSRRAPRARTSTPTPCRRRHLDREVGEHVLRVEHVLVHHVHVLGDAVDVGPDADVRRRSRPARRR